MRRDSSKRGYPRVLTIMRPDFSPALLAVALVFVVIASVQFLRDLPGGERGLLLFEQTCPLRPM
jgi:hypothetical protein